MASKLIGLTNSSKRAAAETVRRLTSIKPYGGFSITGARRSGRSSFFVEVARLLNANDDPAINCFVGELSEATRGGFENTLLGSIKASDLCSNEYSAFKEKVQTPDGFFLLCETLYKQEGNKIPVFLIDMGRALDEEYRVRGFEGVRDLGMLLRNVVNLAEEKNVSIIMGLGLTLQFVNNAKDAARDTWIDRYGPMLSLNNNAFDSDDPGEPFRQIVKEISGLLIPNRYHGLWRGSTVTAGQLGENLKSSKASEVTSSSLWQNLRGKWDMLRDTTLDDISPADLGELVLADAVIPDNRYKDYLEQCEGGFRANDRLYEHFGFCSPRRDPSKSERIKRRVEDPDDDDVTCDVLLSIGRSLHVLGLHNISKPEALGQKCAWMEAQVEEFPGSDLDDFEKQLFKAALPRKLAIVAFLTAGANEDVLIEKLKNSAGISSFILILFREGIDFGRMPLGRYIEKHIPSASLQALSLDVVVSLLETPEEVFHTEVDGWVNDSISKLFIRKPPLCVGNSTVKQLVSGTIGCGSLEIDKFAEHKGISKGEVNKYLNLLTEPQILEKKKGVALWDPANDVVLNALLKHKGDKEKISADIMALFAVAQVDVEELASLYQCITGDKGLDGLKKERILAHCRQIQNHRLVAIKNSLEALRNKSGLYDELTNKHETYQSRELNEISDVAPYLTDILKLIEDAQQELRAVEEQEKKCQQELAEKKASLINELERHTAYFSAEETKQHLEKIEGIRSLTSPSLDQIARAICNRKKQVDELSAVRRKLATQLATLQSTLDPTKYEETRRVLEEIQELINRLRLDDAEKLEDSVDEELRTQERLAERRAIASRYSGASVPNPLKKYALPANVPPSGPPKIEDSALVGSVGPPELPDSPPELPDSRAQVLPDVPTEVRPALPREKTFDMSNPEERRALARMLIEHRSSVIKINIEVTD